LNSVTVGELYDTHAQRLNLSWVAGRDGARREISLAVHHSVNQESRDENADHDSEYPLAPSKSLVGHLNLIHPNQIQILGSSEQNYLAGMREISRLDSLRQLMRQNPACILIAESQPVPEELRRACEDSRTPLLSSSVAGEKLSETLHYYLSNLLAEIVTLHGVYMEVTAIGVLITGPAGVGKSELALDLITRGHRLVADDAPQFSRLAPDIINGTCPESLADFLEVRGIGILNVRELFGDSAIKGNKYLRLIINLEPLRSIENSNGDRLEGSYRTRKILDIDIPEITLPVAPGRNLAVLVECAARNHILRMNGYNASEDFIKRQADTIAGNS